MPSYTKQQKQAALTALITDTVKQVSEETGIAPATLRRWRRKHKATRKQRHAAKQERLHETLGNNAIQIVDTMQDKIADAPLNQLATALNAVVDRYLKLDEKLAEQEAQNEEKVVRFEYIMPDGEVYDAPPWTMDDFHVPNPLSSGGLREAVWEDGDSQTDHRGESLSDGDDLLVAGPDVPNGRGSLAGFEDEAAV